MSKHTPGPWTLDLGNIGVDMRNHVPVDSPDHGGIAQVVWVMEDDASASKSTPACEANARLIASAPDLLAALQGMVDRFSNNSTDQEDQPKTYGCHHMAETCTQCEGLVTGWKAVQAARAAIAKVTGGAQ